MPPSPTTPLPPPPPPTPPKRGDKGDWVGGCGNFCYGGRGLSTFRRMGRMEGWKNRRPSF